MEVASSIIKTYFCPSRRAPEALPTDKGDHGLPPNTLRGQIDYAGNGGPGGAGGFQFIDSKTYVNNSSYDPQFGAVIPGSPHFGVVQFVFCDGGVRPVPYTIDLAVFRALSDRRDGKAPEL
jgi:hypothetical protein